MNKDQSVFWKNLSYWEKVFCDYEMRTSLLQTFLNFMS